MPTDKLGAVDIHNVVSWNGRQVVEANRSDFWLAQAEQVPQDWIMVGITVINAQRDAGVGDNISEGFGIGHSAHEVDIVDVVGPFSFHHPEHELFDHFSPERIPDDIDKPVGEYLEHQFCQDPPSDLRDDKGWVKGIIRVFSFQFLWKFGSQQDIFGRL